jgi:hypothetical protein
MAFTACLHLIIMQPKVLSKTELKKYGKMSSGKMRIQLVANQNVVFKFLRSKDGIRLLFVGMSS